MTARNRFWSIVVGTVFAVLATLILFSAYQDELDADDRPCGGRCR